MKTLAIATKHLHVSMDKTPVLHSLDLSIEAGRWTCVVGPNGAGKSTLLKALAGLIPTQGQLLVLGQPLQDMSDKDRARNRGLGCQSRPTGPLQIKLRTSDKYAPQFPPVRTAATFIASRTITHDLSEFTFQTELPLPFLSGQYALMHMDGIAGPRAYSMSNVGLFSGATQGGHLIEFQVRRVPGGHGSAHLFDQLQAGNRV